MKTGVIDVNGLDVHYGDYVIIIEHPNGNKSSHYGAVTGWSGDRIVVMDENDTRVDINNGSKVCIINKSVYAFIKNLDNSICELYRKIYSK